jgi:hypothetical protein
VRKPPAGGTAALGNVDEPLEPIASGGTRPGSRLRVPRMTAWGPVVCVAPSPPDAPPGAPPPPRERS